MARRYYENGLMKALHTVAFLRPEVEGEYSYKESYSPEFRRHINFAYLKDAHSSETLRLIDAVPLYCVGAELIVRGTQYDDVSRLCTVQTWIMDMIDVPVHPPAVPRWPRETPMGEF
jgi:hypothetical protein